jgi:uncharacterized damage-inducible protein DinB
VAVRATVLYGGWMSRSLMADAFAHHVWATVRLIDTCSGLRPKQLEIAVPGTYGSILKTMRHLVGADSWYLVDITGDRTRRIEEDHMGLPELRAVIESDGPAWSVLLAQDPDPDVVVTEVDEEDGYEKDAPIGIRLAQALHHGSDHRSQICTALSTLGVDPPAIDVWDLGLHDGRVVERTPTP